VYQFIKCLYSTALLIIQISVARAPKADGTDLLYAHGVSRLLSSQSQNDIATDGQSVSMFWCRAQSETFDQSFFFQSYCLVLFGAPSLTRGRACHVSVFVIEVYHSLVYLQQYLHSI
jgi:hypothetical protein